VIQSYDFNQEIAVPREELLGMGDQVPTSGIMNLEEMAQFVESFEKNQLIKLSQYNRSPLYIEDEELKFIDNLLDDRIINSLLRYEGYRSGGRVFLPSHFFRAELLKAIKYPEIAYRKFCTKECIGKDRKQNRVFIGLPLNEKKTIDHTQLSQFRTRFTFSQLVNVLVYILHHFKQSGLLGDEVVHPQRGLCRVLHRGVGVLHRPQQGGQLARLIQVRGGDAGVLRASQAQPDQEL